MREFFSIPWYTRVLYSLEIYLQRVYQFFILLRSLIFITICHFVSFVSFRNRFSGDNIFVNKNYKINWQHFCWARTKSVQSVRIEGSYPGWWEKFGTDEHLCIRKRPWRIYSFICCTLYELGIIIQKRD